MKNQCRGGALAGQEGPPILVGPENLGGRQDQNNKGQS
jgi:hypothetical protein